jgi:acyl-coenzyme A synthetase/AMP-(fatty) acid ligase
MSKNEIEFIEIGGKRVPAKEIEDLLIKHPSVYDAAVITIEKENKNSIIIYLAIRKGTPINFSIRMKIKDGLRQKYGPAFVPEKIIIVDSLPKSKVELLRKASD